MDIHSQPLPVSFGHDWGSKKDERLDEGCTRARASSEHAAAHQSRNEPDTPRNPQRSPRPFSTGIPAELLVSTASEGEYWPAPEHVPDSESTVNNPPAETPLEMPESENNTMTTLAEATDGDVDTVGSAMPAAPSVQRPPSNNRERAYAETHGMGKSTEWTAKHGLCNDNDQVDDGISRPRKRSRSSSQPRNKQLAGTTTCLGVGLLFALIGGSLHHRAGRPMPYLAGGVVGMIVAGIGWLWLRRRGQSTRGVPRDGK